MGNFSLSPTENKNQSFNKSNIYKETGKGIIDNVNNKFDNSNNISNFGNSKKSKKNTYLYGYRQKSNKKIKSNNNPKRTTKTKSQNKVLSSIQEYTSFLLPKSIIPKTQIMTSFIVVLKFMPENRNVCRFKKCIEMCLMLLVSAL